MVGGPVEVKGTVRCEPPLISPFTRTPCVWYSAALYERIVEWERDKDGNQHRHEREYVRERKEELATFAVEDRTGRVLVDAQDAEIDGDTLLDDITTDQDEHWNRGIGVELWPSEDTLGFRYVEQAIPLGASLYVLGALRADGSIGAPEIPDELHFIVSTRSEQEQEKSLVSQSRWMKVGWLLIPAGGIALVASLVWYLLG
nr:GIDE domain-containing protein [Jiella sp. LLJ827]